MTPVAHPALSELMQSAQRQPIPEVLAKIDDSYKDVEQTFRVFQERRRQSIVEQGPFNNIVSKLAEDEFHEPAPLIDIPASEPQSVAGSTNIRPNMAQGRSAPGSSSSINVRRRSSASVMAAAQLVTQMAAVTASVSSDQVTSAAARLTSDSRRASQPHSRADLPGAASGGGDSHLIMPSSRSALSASPSKILECTSAPIVDKVLSAVRTATTAPADEPEPVAMPTSPPVAAPATLASSPGAAAAGIPRPPARLEPVRTSPHLPTVSGPGGGGDLGLLPGGVPFADAPPQRTTTTITAGAAAAAAPVFQVVVAGEGEVGGKPRPDIDFIPVAPKMDMGMGMGALAPAANPRARAKSVDESAAAGGAKPSWTAVIAAARGVKDPKAMADTEEAKITNTFKKWKTNAKKKKSSERQRRIEEGQRRLISEIPDTIRLDMVREALPVVQKMIEQYKAQLGERDEITQGAMAHHTHLLGMLPRSHVYSEDAASFVNEDGPYSGERTMRTSRSFARNSFAAGPGGFAAAPTAIIARLSHLGAGEGLRPGSGGVGRVVRHSGSNIGGQSTGAMPSGNEGGKGKSVAITTNAKIKKSAAVSSPRKENFLKLDDILSDEHKGFGARLTGRGG
ncbi:hypothetical protein H9P43_004532 [Blastocladiella emersonii ATCC 22665]|nr:hypothetical protein H9P43_004532 [Blastocladiella emersonii ATCC 22665]